MDAILNLRPLTLDDEAEAVRAHEELAADGFSFLLGDWRPGADWAEHVAAHERWSRGEDLRDGWVPATFLLAEADGAVVGRVSIRHALNEYLSEVGGHVGYGVRPQFRRRGYATRMLSVALDRCRALGLDRVLVTCDDDNPGSARAIERCGGVFERFAVDPDDPEGKVPKRRYWISL